MSDEADTYAREQYEWNVHRALGEARTRIGAALAYLELPGPQMCCGICDEDRRALRRALGVHRDA